MEDIGNYKTLENKRVTGTPELLDLHQEKRHIDTDRQREKAGRELMKATFQRITVANIQNPQTLMSETLSHRG